MPNRLIAPKKQSKSGEPPYVGWRAELIAKVALTRVNLAVQDAPPPQPLHLLASTSDGFYLLIAVKGYSSMHGGRQPKFDRSGQEYQWPVEAPVIRAAAKVNLPVVLFVIDADREVGHYARLDRLPPVSRDQRTTFVPLVAHRDLSQQSLIALLSDLRRDWAAARRPA